MNEFEFIASQLKPLAGSFAGALNLEDDAAILTPETGQELVVTTDALTAGVHFFASDPPHFIAQKCLRVNLSDIAAMGAAAVATLANRPAWGQDPEVLQCVSATTWASFNMGDFSSLTGGLDTNSSSLPSRAACGVWRGDRSI